MVRRYCTHTVFKFRIIQIWINVTLRIAVLWKKIEVRDTLFLEMKCFIFSESGEF